MNLRPTLLVNQPDLPAKVRASWRTSNYDDVYIPGHYGSVSHVACAKALYLGFESPSDSWCDSAFHITISAPQKELPSMDALQLAEITKHFQSRYLMWRLDKVVGITDSWRGPGQLNLPACLAEEPGFTTVIAPLVERQKQEALVRKQCDINCVIIEVIWGPSHEEREISVEDITQETNTLLRDRGEFLKYSNEEVGWRLKSCGVSRERVDSGMIVRFSREQRWRVHQAASMCGLSLPIVEGCPDCGSREERPVVEP